VEQGLKSLGPLDRVDLICAPDLMLEHAQATELQQKILKHCKDTGDRFAILDSRPEADLDKVLEQRRELKGANGALYYPWIQMKGVGFVPPCGHIAGIYARTDASSGVYEAPANEILEGVIDLENRLGNAEQERLNPVGVNCLRVFPGRGIRVWGARTLSPEPAWTYINVRRLFLTAGRWIERNMSQVVFEPNDSRLWARIGREVTTYFNGLFQKGALKGNTAQEAFYVKCDAETNPPELRESGEVVTEIGLAPARPSEFVVVRIIHGASGTTIVGPTTPA
jgi:phage tail sheath protein FI